MMLQRFCLPVAFEYETHSICHAHRNCNHTEEIIFFKQLKVL